MVSQYQSRNLVVGEWEVFRRGHNDDTYDDRAKLLTSTRDVGDGIYLESYCTETFGILPPRQQQLSSFIERVLS